MSNDYENISCHIVTTRNPDVTSKTCWHHKTSCHMISTRPSTISHVMWSIKGVMSNDQYQDLIFLDAHASLEPTMSVCVCVRLNYPKHSFIPEKISFYTSRTSSVFSIFLRFSECCPDFQNITKIFKISLRFSDFAQIFRICPTFL